MDIDRRKFLLQAGRVTCGVALAGGAVALVNRARGSRGEWVINTDLCVGCGDCETHCVKDKSAVVARNFYNQCGMCAVCYGYEVDDHTSTRNAMNKLRQGDGSVTVSNQVNPRVCPVDAIKRRTVHVVDEAMGDDYKCYEYEVDEDLCTGCGLCVKLCGEHGNKTLKMIVRSDRCLGCNQCTIATSCDERAFYFAPNGTQVKLATEDPL